MPGMRARSDRARSGFCRPGKEVDKLIASASVPTTTSPSRSVPASSGRVQAQLRRAGLPTNHDKPCRSSPRFLFWTNAASKKTAARRTQQCRVFKFWPCSPAIPINPSRGTNFRTRGKRTAPAAQTRSWMHIAIYAPETAKGDPSIRRRWNRHEKGIGYTNCFCGSDAMP